MSNYFYKNLYEILGISTDADEMQIKAAYRILVRKYHPDVNPNDSNIATKFKEITEAYEILLDKDKKELYDRFKGFYKDKKQANHNTAYQENSYKKAKKSYEKAETDSTNTSKDSTSSFSNIFNDILEGLFTPQKKQDSKKTQSKQGKDITVNVSISYQEALEGTNRTINVLHTQTCPNCQGKRFINGNKCPLCNASGETSIYKKINVKIPSNIKQNSKIRLANEGNVGENGGKRGDLYLIVNIENKDANFKYEGLNVFTEIPIQSYEAVLGTNIKLYSPQGSVNIKIPENTHSGQKFRISGHGLKNPGSKEIGDFIVSVKIDISKEISVEEKLLYKQLQKLNKYNIRQGIN